jgi:hypothetical protein
LGKIYIYLALIAIFQTLLFGFCYYNLMWFITDTWPVDLKNRQTSFILFAWLFWFVLWESIN